MPSSSLTRSAPPKPASLNPNLQEDVKLFLDTFGHQCREKAKEEEILRRTYYEKTYAPVKPYVRPPPPEKTPPPAEKLPVPPERAVTKSITFEYDSDVSDGPDDKEDGDYKPSRSMKTKKNGKNTNKKGKYGKQPRQKKAKTSVEIDLEELLSK